MIKFVTCAETIMSMQKQIDRLEEIAAPMHQGEASEIVAWLAMHRPDIVEKIAEELMRCVILKRLQKRESVNTMIEG